MLILNFCRAVFHLTSILIPSLQKLSLAKSHTHPQAPPRIKNQHKQHRNSATSSEIPPAKHREENFLTAPMWGKLAASLPQMEGISKCYQASGRDFPCGHCHPTVRAFYWTRTAVVGKGSMKKDREFIEALSFYICTIYLNPKPPPRYAFFYSNSKTVLFLTVKRVFQG